MSAQPTSQHDTPSPAAGARRDRHRVVVVGGGFGGLNVVRELGRSAVAGDLDVVLVDKRNHHTFQPLLYQVATAGLQPHDIGMSLRSIRGVRRTGPDGRPTTDVRLGEVVDVDDHGVVLADGARLPYDHLVVAAGGITNDLGIPGVAEHAFGLKSLPEAAQLRNHLLRRFEAASADPAHLSDGTLTFVIAGGGPTGVELAGALAELVDQVLTEDHPTLDIAHVRIVLLELTDRLLPGFSDRSHRVALQRLERRGVEVRLGTGAEEVTADQDTSVDVRRDAVREAVVAVERHERLRGDDLTGRHVDLMGPHGPLEGVDVKQRRARSVPGQAVAEREATGRPCHGAVVVDAEQRPAVPGSPRCDRTDPEPTYRVGGAVVHPPRSAGAEVAPASGDLPPLVAAAPEHEEGLLARDDDASGHPRVHEGGPSTAAVSEDGWAPRFSRPHVTGRGVDPPPRVAVPPWALAEVRARPVGPRGHLGCHDRRGSSWLGRPYVTSHAGPPRAGPGSARPLRRRSSR